MSKEAWGEPEDFDNDAVLVTEMLLRMPPPVTRGLIVNMPASGTSHEHRLFQAQMWRRYAMTWHGIPYDGTTQRWCENVARMTYEGCLRRARINLYLARRLRRAH